MVVRQRDDINVCVIGDFNSILDEGERVGEGENESARERLEFEAFVEKSRLFDVELQGRRFTWYKCKGGLKSRIDRALVNGRWLQRWQDSEL